MQCISRCHTWRECRHPEVNVLEQRSWRRTDSVWLFYEHCGYYMRKQPVLMTLCASLWWSRWRCSLWRGRIWERFQTGRAGAWHFRVCVYRLGAEAWSKWLSPLFARTCVMRVTTSYEWAHRSLQSVSRRDVHDHAPTQKTQSDNSYAHACMTSDFCCYTVFSFNVYPRAISGLHEDISVCYSPTPRTRSLLTCFLSQLKTWAIRLLQLLEPTVKRLLWANQQKSR